MDVHCCVAVEIKVTVLLRKRAREGERERALEQEREALMRELLILCTYCRLLFI